ncbi:MAG: neutral/alkaline non-lysosomal ceramidase N-terminal domain-containing protein [Phycisphaerae bacterium]
MATAWGVPAADGQAVDRADIRPWKAGLAKAVITPARPLWMGGYASRTRPAEGTLHDLWIKVLALEDEQGRRAVLLTSDLLGVPRQMYEDVIRAVRERYRLDRSQVLLTASHTHCGPAIRESLFDCYALDPGQVADIEAYSDGLEKKMLAAIGEALSALAPATLWAGEGTAGFAVNRRNNVEAQVPELLAAGRPLQGPVDHSVPVLAVRSPDGRLLAVVFGYACHNTTLNFYKWCGDYAGFAQIELEKRHPGAQAMFWQGCGADQNPLPRRSVELCEKYGTTLAGSADEVLARPMRPLAPVLRTGFDFVMLDFDGAPTREQLETLARSDSEIIDRRWARRLLRILDRDGSLPKQYRYPVAVWRLGDQLWIALGGEAVVDYALSFKEKFGRRTWVAGYTNDVMAYIPSRRVWNEGGYESGALHVYGQPADRWGRDIEERITRVVERLVDATARVAESR